MDRELGGQAFSREESGLSENQFPRRESWSSDLSVRVPGVPSCEASGHELGVRRQGGPGLASQLTMSSILAPRAGVGAPAPSRGEGSAGLGPKLGAQADRLPPGLGKAQAWLTR